MRCLMFITFLFFPILSLACTPCSVASTADNFQGCPFGWVHREGKCYKLFTDLKTWKEAEATCVGYNGHLASVTCKPEHDFLLDYILREVDTLDLKYVWVGGYRKRTKYTWTDLQPFVYADWHSMHSSYNDFTTYPTYDCVQFVTFMTQYMSDPEFGKIINHPCHQKDNYICQRPAEVASSVYGNQCNKNPSFSSGGCGKYPEPVHNLPMP